ncbi:hypothetical protein WN48_02956 [Eufriesea mexicana]|uniref:Uncharacterized protein n=1 Tax=Eufriesea mexicana TaxID=516756 RepID=A0A310S6Z4_9HYME|nr:hypothetical protein WN48_02956 [Eufriesea mexicana]
MVALTYSRSANNCVAQSLGKYIIKGSVRWSQRERNSEVDIVYSVVFAIGHYGTRGHILGSWFGLFLSVLYWWIFEGVQRLREEQPRTVANFDHASMDGFLCLKSSRLPDSWDYICLSDQASENHLGTNAWPSM